MNLAEAVNPQSEFLIITLDLPSANRLYLTVSSHLHTHFLFPPSTCLSLHVSLPCFLPTSVSFFLPKITHSSPSTLYLLILSLYLHLCLPPTLPLSGSLFSFSAPSLSFSPICSLLYLSLSSSLFHSPPFCLSSSLCLCQEIIFGTIPLQAVWPESVDAAHIRVD